MTAIDRAASVAVTSSQTRCPSPVTPWRQVRDSMRRSSIRLLVITFTAPAWVGSD